MYLLHNGTDTPTCGFTVSDACATFPGVLDNFGAKHNTTDQPTLEIISDVSIVLNKKLLVKTSTIVFNLKVLLYLFNLEVLFVQIHKLTSSPAHGILKNDGIDYPETKRSK